MQQQPLHGYWSILRAISLNVPVFFRYKGLGRLRQGNGRNKTAAALHGRRFMLLVAVGFVSTELRSHRTARTAEKMTPKEHVEMTKNSSAALDLGEYRHWIGIRTPIAAEFSTFLSRPKGCYSQSAEITFFKDRTDAGFR